MRDFKGRFCSKKTQKIVQNLRQGNELNIIEVVEDKSEEVSIFGGRRIVELDLLAQVLDEGCENCKTPLKLSNTTKETTSGLGSYLYINCDNPDCGETSVCPTNKQHRNGGKNRGRSIFDVNTGLAAGNFSQF